MSASDLGSLLDQAHLARAAAARARRLSAGQSRSDEITLSRYADEMDAKAVALEQQAFSLAPGMQSHPVPQQMQQAPPAAKTDDED